LEYDDVMNIQREAIYKKRDNALSGERLSVDINNMFIGLIESVVLNNKSNGNFENYRMDCLRLLGMDPKMTEHQFEDGNENDIVDELEKQYYEAYEAKSQRIAEALMPHINHVVQTEGNRYKRISIPFTDGRKKPLPISAHLETAVETNGASIMRDVEKAVVLALIDRLWKGHLREMDELKDSSQAASFEQKDPLVVYKMEAYGLFEKLIFAINENVTSYLAKGTLMFKEDDSLKQAKEQKTDLSKTSTNKREGTEQQNAARRAAQSVGQTQAKPETFKRTEKKVGRNEPCPCGSGKKYKQCHGRA